jgi:hypothetical protein
MAGLPKGLIKKHSGNLKAAWAEHRRNKGGKKSSKKTTKKRKKSVTAQTSGGSVKKKRKKNTTTSDRPRRARRAVASVISSRPAQMLMDAAFIGGGAVSTSVAVNKLPFLRDQSGTVKALSQAGFGFALVVFAKKFPVLRKLGGGALVAAFLSAIRNTTGIDPLAGNGRRLTQDEIQRLRKALGAPVSYQRNLSAPVSYQRNLGSQAPNVPAFNSGWTPGW